MRHKSQAEWRFAKRMSTLLVVGIILSFAGGCGTKPAVPGKAKPTGSDAATANSESGTDNIDSNVDSNVGSTIDPAIEVTTNVVADATVTAATDQADWKFSDIHGVAHEPFADENTKAIVVVFITTDCPIANYYQPTLSRMTDDYANQGVQFYLCHSDRDTKLEEALEHTADFKPRAHVLLDNEQAIARRLEAKVTPEAFLVTREGTVAYRGRINDLYADYGKRRNTPRTNDLRDAVDRLLAGKPIETAVTRAIGCYIPYPKEDK